MKICSQPIHCRANKALYWLFYLVTWGLLLFKIFYLIPSLHGTYFSTISVSVPLMTRLLYKKIYSRDLYPANLPILERISWPRPGYELRHNFLCSFVRFSGTESFVRAGEREGFISNLLFDIAVEDDAAATWGNEASRGYYMNNSRVNFGDFSAWVSAITCYMSLTFEMIMLFALHINLRKLLKTDALWHPALVIYLGTPLVPIAAMEASLGTIKEANETLQALDLGYSVKVLTHGHNIQRIVFTSSYFIYFVYLLWKLSVRYHRGPKVKHTAQEDTEEVSECPPYSAVDYIQYPLPAVTRPPSYRSVAASMGLENLGQPPSYEHVQRMDAIGMIWEESQMV